MRDAASTARMCRGALRRVPCAWVAAEVGKWIEVRSVGAAEQHAAIIVLLPAVQ